jgi:hypothetical protein
VRRDEVDASLLQAQKKVRVAGQRIQPGNDELGTEQLHTRNASLSWG